jgi:sugar phosphate isomerase/epimerase
MDAYELAKVIKEAGFSCVQLAPTKAINGIISHEDITERRLSEIKQGFEKMDLEITVLGCYIEPALPNETERLTQVEYFKNGIVNAKKLGVGIVGTETCNLSISADASTREKQYLLLKDSVFRLIEVAEKEDVLIGIEPVAEHTLNTPALARRLLNEVNSDKLKIIFDPVNLVLPETVDIQDDIFDDTFKLLGDDIVAMHIKDVVIYHGQKVWCKIGEGIINYPRMFDWLKKNKQNIGILREEAHTDSYKLDINAINALIN